MTDARPLADDAVQQLDRLAAAILDDVGDGPTPAVFAELAAGVRDAVGRVGVPAFSELTGLVVGIADSLGDGSTDWSPSLGGTLMAAVDDLRTLVIRGAQFSAEDSEHLHHRASELAVYVRASRRGTVADTTTPTPPVDVGSPIAPPKQPADSPAAEPISQTPPKASSNPTIVPISDLFYADGPSVVSGGIPASAAPRSDLLSSGIDALENLTSKPLAAPLSSGPMAIVPVETLMYRGRAALERAAAIREQIRTSGAHASPAALDEMYDLIGLALKD